MALEQKVKCDRCDRYGNGLFIRPAPHDLNDLAAGGLAHAWKLKLFGIIGAVNRERVLEPPRFLTPIQIDEKYQFLCSPKCFADAILESVGPAWQAALSKPGETRISDEDA